MIREDVTKNNKYDSRLAGLRGLAAVSVILFHINSLLGIGIIAFGGNNYLPFFFFSQSVSLFFVLSMYLLLNSLDRNPDLYRYFKRRIIRIWPIYFGCIVVTYAILHQESASQMIQFLLFANYTSPLPSGTGVFWSLEVEEIMYLAIPLIWRAKNKNVIAALMIGTSIVWVTAIHLLSDLIFIVPSGTVLPWFLNPSLDSSLLFSPPSWLIAYGVGILAYTSKRVPRWLMFSVPVIMVIGAVSNGLISSKLWPDGLMLEGLVNNQYYATLLLWSILPGFASLVVNPPRSLSLFAVVGEFSYALYALQLYFIFAFGIRGVLILIPAAFLLELVLRPREIPRRLAVTYPQASLLGSKIAAKLRMVVA